MDVAKRECILEAAVRAFVRFGFKKASVDAIARAAGVAKGTIYLACDSKADLFYQAVHRELRAWIAEVARTIDPRLPADVLLKKGAEVGISYLEARPLVRDLLLGLHRANIPGWSERFDELRALGQQNLIEVLRIGIRQGIFRSDLDVEPTAEVLQDMHLSGYLFHLQGPDPRPEAYQERYKIGFELVLNGLMRR
jgi:AcrR family transcriptional regulator